MSNRIQTSSATLVREQPFSTISLDFLQSGMSQSNAALAQSFLSYVSNNTLSPTGPVISPTASYAMYGVELTTVGPNYVISPGWVWFNNEVFRVNGGSWPVSSGDDFWFNITDYYDPSINPVQFSDFTSWVNVHDYRYLDITQGVGSGDFWIYNMYYFPSIPSRIASATASIYTDMAIEKNAAGWTDVTAAADWTTGGTGIVNCQVYRNYGMVSFKGGFTFIGTTASISGNLMATVPLGFRPTSARHLICQYTYSGGSVLPALIQVHTDGTITIDHFQANGSAGPTTMVAADGIVVCIDAFNYTTY
jgi:hypothetical protein